MSSTIGQGQQARLADFLEFLMQRRGVVKEPAIAGCIGVDRDCVAERLS